MSTEQERFNDAPDMVYFVIAFAHDGRQQHNVHHAYVDEQRAHEMAVAEAEASGDQTTTYVVGVDVSYLAEVRP